MLNICIDNQTRSRHCHLLIHDVNEQLEDVQDFVSRSCYYYNSKGRLVIRNEAGKEVKVNPGDHIVQLGLHKYIVCKPKVFEANYTIEDESPNGE